METKKLLLALVALAAFTQAQARERVYQPKTFWPVCVAEDAVVGTAGVITLGQTDADPSALPMTVPDAIPGVSYARTKDNDTDKPAKKQKAEKTEKKKTEKRKSDKKEASSEKSKKAKTEKKKCEKKKCEKKKCEKKDTAKKSESCKTKKTKTDKKSKTKKSSDAAVVAAPVVVPVTVAADVVTLDTQHYTSRALDDMNGSEEEVVIIEEE